MQREQMIYNLTNGGSPWDVIVIGGGASGLGAALDAITRGYNTLLVEQHDFSKGTSSRSTKLVHGGVRYLQKGDVSLVLEALNERGLLMKNASHLVKNQRFIIPNYNWWEGSFYTVGMKVYDMMSGKLGLGHSEHLSKNEVLSKIPNINEEELKGGVIYHDGQFDDARLAINLAQSIVDHGGTVINYMKCTGLIKNDGMVKGILTKDEETGKLYEVRGKVVVNATGIWVDEILQMETPG